MKERVDRLLTTTGLCDSLAEARRLILAGRVRVGADDVVRKPNRELEADARLSIVDDLPYASRGALKLLPALKRFRPPLPGSIALDIGAAAGGFTDCLLQFGIERVYAVDVGYGQLHYRLRCDPRVVCLERTHARDLNVSLVPEPATVLTADVSFISLCQVLPWCVPLLAENACSFLLVKPQFEADRCEVERGGVVRDPVVHERCVAKVSRFAVDTLGWQRLGVVPSPISGPAGNREFVAVFRTGHGRASRAASEPQADAPVPRRP